MSNKDKASLVPKLRFPEFREATPWTVRQLNELLFEAKRRNRTLELGPGDVLSVSGEYGCVNQIEFMGRSYAGVSVKDYHVVEHGDIVYTKSPLKKNPYGIIKENKGKRGIVSTLYAVYRPFPGCSPTYLDHFFSGDYNLNAYLQPIVKKGAKNDMKVNNADVLKGDICVPELQEQQKIADCLSSLDELIAAQARKVDALKTHKKGLMQQLFPREGETQPRLRFPEFQSAGKWEGKTFSDLCNIKHGYAFESEFFSNEGDFVLLTPGNFYEEGGYRDRGGQQKYFTGKTPQDYVLAENDMLVAMTEQAAGLLGSPMLVPQSEKFLHNQRLGLVAKKPGVTWTNEFFFYVFNTSRVRKAIHDTASGAKVRHTSPTKIGEVAISVPTSLPEQQRIANCFNSLDDVIASETQELETLKTHKNGLMKQLFPVLEERQR